MAEPAIKGSGRVVGNVLIENSGVLASFIRTFPGTYMATMAPNQRFGPSDTFMLTPEGTAAIGSTVDRLTDTTVRVLTTTLGGGAALADADFSFRIATVLTG